MSAIRLSKMLGSKASNTSRTISVLRERTSVGNVTEEVNAPASTASSADDDATQPPAASLAASPDKIGLVPIPEEFTNDGNAGDSHETKLDIIAPAGKLGVTVDSPPEGGSAYVSSVKEESPVWGKIHLGDTIVAVDGEDVSKLKAIHVSMLLGSKSRNAKRKITVLRNA